MTKIFLQETFRYSTSRPRTESLTFQGHSLHSTFHTRRGLLGCDAV